MWINCQAGVILGFGSPWRPISIRYFKELFRIKNFLEYSKKFLHWLEFSRTFNNSLILLPNSLKKINNANVKLKLWFVQNAPGQTGYSVSNIIILINNLKKFYLSWNCFRATVSRSKPWRRSANFWRKRNGVW